MVRAMTALWKIVVSLTCTFTALCIAINSQGVGFWSVHFAV
ncbi:MAG: hypothetical protein JWR61_1780 [Ferruginibacter sp.]|nr:hypothetical protein [Ferruginibacter sp.]